MGASINLYCRTHAEPPECNIEGSWRPVNGGSGYAPTGATHRLLSPVRYYGIGYERGPWNVICGDLLRLLSDPSVEAVWYEHDDGWSNTDKLTFEFWLEICSHYATHGNASWRLKPKERVQ